MNSLGEKREKGNVPTFSINIVRRKRKYRSFHIQLIPPLGRSFHSPRAKERQEGGGGEETSRYHLVIDDKKERWHRADTRKSLVAARIVCLESWGLSNAFSRAGCANARQLSQRDAWIPNIFLSSNRQATRDTPVTFKSRVFWMGGPLLLAMRNFSAEIFRRWWTADAPIEWKIECSALVTWPRSREWRC